MGALHQITGAGLTGSNLQKGEKEPDTLTKAKGSVTFAANFHINNGVSDSC
jgi:hypothetical protein